MVEEEDQSENAVGQTTAHTMQRSDLEDFDPSQSGMAV
jgi:hypothetical protein